MRRAAIAVSLAAGLALVPTAPAGADDEDRGRIAGWLESQLSSVGREVRIEGFRGALSARVEMDRLSIADADGVWLVIEGAALDWNRLAVLRGRIEISELAAESIELLRLPAPDPALPSAEAPGFALPDLPVSIEIGSLRADRFLLGEPVLGETATLSLAGGVSLVARRADARLTAERIDTVEGSLHLTLAYDEPAGRVQVDLALDEAPGGIAARLLNLPGLPSVALELAGDGPFDDFDAALRLATDGAERLSGRFRLAAAGAPGNGPARGFLLDVGGDIAPLFAPAYREFFGPDIRLSAAGSQRGDGGLSLERLEIAAAALDISGAAEIAPDGLPERFTLDGRLLPPDGERVVLPLAGPPVSVAGGAIGLAFDSALGEIWDLRADLALLAREDLRIDALSLAGSGRIGRHASGLREVTADIRLEARGLMHDDPAVATAMGQEAQVAAGILWRDGEDLLIERFAAEGPSWRAGGEGRIGAFAEGLPASGRLRAGFDEIAALSGLAGRPLGGEVALEASGSGRLLGGEVDLELVAETRDLAVGEARIDRLLAGSGRLDLAVMRDAGGLALPRLEVTTPALDLAAAGDLRTGAGQMEVRLGLAELGLLLEGVSGPAALEATAQLENEALRLEATATGPGEARLAASGLLADPTGLPAFEGRASLDIADLRAWAAVADDRLAGSFEATGDLAYGAADGSFALSGRAALDDLRFGPDVVATLMRGTTRLELDAVRAAGTAPVEIARARVENAQGGLRLSGRIGAGDGELTLEARLADAALLTPDLAGPLTLSGVISEVAEGYALALEGSGPGGSDMRLSGRVAADLATTDIAARGSLPLALADPFLGAARARGTARYDLALRGAPGLAALTGSIETDAARVILPGFGLALDPLSARVALAPGARARIDARTGVEGGGTATLGGDVDLGAAGLPGNLALALAGVVQRDRALYETRLDGEVRVAGPLAGGAMITGEIRLGPTEIRVPSGPVGGAVALLPVRHLGAPADVRASRARAGLNGADAGPARAGPAYGLDLTVLAPQRIFLRGRGLDAELGGSVRLRGTTAAPAPDGRFELIRGRLDILGRRLDLSEGWAQLQGGTDPELFLRARSETPDGIVALVTLSGRASALDITFSSEPELPEDEVLARLFFGRGIDRISPLQAAQLASALADLAGGGSGGGLVGRLRESFGLDDLDIQTDETGAPTLRVGRYLSENVYTDVIIGPDGRSTITINLDLPRGVTARGRLDDEGGSGIGVFIERDY